MNKPKILLIGDLGHGKSAAREMIAELLIGKGFEVIKLGDVVTEEVKARDWFFDEAMILDGITGKDIPIIAPRTVMSADEIRELSPKNKTINIGAIGHLDHGKTTLSAAIEKTIGYNVNSRRNKSDRKRNRKDRWR